VLPSRGVAIRVFIDGELADERTASISVFDRGFLYGDSVYEVTRTAGGRPVDLARHLERLARSASAIGIECPAAEVVAAAIARTLAAAANPDSYVRIIVTRGAGELGLDPALADRPRLIVIVRPLVLPPPEAYRDGVDVAIVEIRRNPRRALDPAVKSGNYLNNVLALGEAKRGGAHESIMLNPEGRLVEGASSNVFVARGDGLVTPAFEDGLLDGITRRRVLELCAAAGIPAGEAHLGADDLRGAPEAFITSSIRGVVPIARVDGRPLAAAPGPRTREVMARYAGFLDEEAAR
jgi:branched-chain amino acid aminotransferase